MSDDRPERVLLSRPCRYILPKDLTFEGLADPVGGEVVRILFSLGPRGGTTLEMPLSAEAFAALTIALCSRPGD